MIRYKLLLVSLLATLVQLTVSAQQLQASLSHYSTDDGLASNAIAHIIQDDHGYIWIATWNGLSRFNGYEFYNYKTGNASHIPNLHNRILSMVTDQQQNVWLRMYDGRVFVLDRHRDRIVNPFEMVSGSEDYRTSTTLSTSLFTMNNGDVLVSIEGVGIYRMHLDKNKSTAELITTAQLKVNTMAEGYHDDIWVGTDKGLHRIDMANLSIERRGIFEDEEVTALYSNGYNVYAGCKSGAIYEYSYGQDPKQLRKPTGMSILSIYFDSHGILWFCDIRYGANRLNIKEGNEKHFEQVVPAPEHDDSRCGFCRILSTPHLNCQRVSSIYQPSAEDWRSWKS